MLGEILKSSLITVLTFINLISNSGMVAILARSREIQEDSSTPLLLALNLSDLLHGATFGTISLALSWMGVTVPIFFNENHKTRKPEPGCCFGYGKTNNHSETTESCTTDH